MTQTIGPATIRTHARRVYADPDGILAVPPRKAKDQRRHEHFDQLMQELQRAKDQPRWAKPSAGVFNFPPPIEETTR